MEKTRKPSLVLLALLSALATLPLAAVKPYAELQAQPSPQPVPTFMLPETVAQGTAIAIDGSPSMAIINRSLEAGFEQQYPGTDVVISTNGDEAALQALRAGSIDLAALGRPLTDAELAENLTEVPISREKIAIIVGRDNPFQGDLTFEDFARIYWGDITNWSQVGGPDLPLRFIDRPASSDTRIALADYDVFQGRPFETGATAVTVQEDDTAAVVRELGNNGVSYAIASEIIGQDAVRPVSMHNTMPDDPRYPYSQPRGYVYQGEPSIPVEAFLGYATNSQGQQDVAAARETEKANVTAGSGQLPDPLALAPDGLFMVRGTQDGTLQWLDAQGNPTAVQVPNAHTGMVTDVVISPDGQTVVSSGADGLIRRWDRSGNPVGNPIQGSGGPVLCLAFSPDGQTLVSGNANGTVERWSLADGSALGPAIAAHDGPVQTLTYPPGGQNFVTGSSDNTIALWNADGSLAIKVPDAHKGGITDITSSPDGQTLITAGGDGTIRQWDRATLRPRGEALPAHTSAVSAVAVSPDGSTIATAGRDATLQLWQPTGTPRLPDAIVLDAPASSLAYNSQGDLVAGTTAGEVDIRDSNGNSVTTPTADGGGLGEIYPDLMRRIQNLPRETWWMLGIIPLLLFLAGIAGAVFGIKPKRGEDPVNGDGDPTPGLSIDFSGMGNSAVTNSPTDPGLPPEAGLVPPQGDPMGSSSVSKLEQARTDLAEGKRLMREGRYDSALIYFNSVVEATEVERYKANASGSMLGGVNAIAAQAQAQRGHALLALDQPNDALDSYNDALKIDSSCIEAWIGKGRLLTSLGRFEEAVFCFDTALEMDDSSGAAWAGKGQALMQMGRQAEAQTCLARATALGYGLEPNLPNAAANNIEGVVPNYPYAPGYGSPGTQPGPTYPSTPVPVTYDPDIPIELQQAVAAIPSEDMVLPSAPGGSYDIPPELQAITTGSTGSISPGGPTPGDALPGTGTYQPPPLTVRPTPGLDSADALIESSHLPPAHNLDEMLSALDLPGTMTGTPSVPPSPPTMPVPPAPPAPVEAGMPPVPLEPGDFIPPPVQQPGSPATDQLAGVPPEVIAAMASIPPDSPDSFGPLPVPTTPPTPVYPGGTGTTGGALAPPVVPIEPGDFIPPPPENGAFSPGTGANPADLPPEVIAAMASIPPDSPDSFGLFPTSPTPAAPDAGTTAPVPATPGESPGSWIKLSLDPGGNRFYTVWHIEDRDRTQAQQQGATTLAIRLYDVTGKTSNAPLTDPVDQIQSTDPMARDWYLSIPQLNRIYLTEVGFLGTNNSWYGVARSEAIPAIS
jgi:WD40 repeat protein/ABC-type phosphate transport system substrate-binding protein/Flp pilus assembly protein TadD